MEEVNGKRVFRSMGWGYGDGGEGGQNGGGSIGGSERLCVYYYFMF